MRRRAEAAYRRALLFCPKRFREAYGEEMTLLFGKRVERAARRGRRAAATEALRGYLDLAHTAAVAWWGRLAFERSTDRRRDTLSRRLSGGLSSSFRSLARQPLTSTSVVTTLALGTGVTLAFFTLTDAALLRPLPYPDAERLVSIVQSDTRFGLVPFAPPYLEDLRERTESFDRVAGFSPSWRLRFLGPDEPHSATAAFVTDGLLDLLGTAAVEGRLFAPPEYAPGGERVALVTRAFWDRHFGSGGRFSEKTIRLDESLYTIVGLVPSRLRLPITTSAVSQRGDPAEIFVPFAANPYYDSRQVPVMNVVGRLRSGRTLGEAVAELHAVGASLANDFPETSRSEVTAVLLRDLVTRGSRRTLTMLLGASAFLLLIACANVASLLLARAEERRLEMAVRSSLGARRSQLVRQLLTESFLLALSGSLFGLLLAWWLVGALPSLGLTELPPSAQVVVNLRVAGTAVLIAVVTTLLFGAAPALHAVRRSELAALRTSRTSTSGNRTQSFLVASEIAVALFLLVGAGLLARSFWNLSRVDPGFRAEGLLAVPLDLTADGYGASERRLFVEEILRRFEAIPNVTAAGVVNRLPLSGGNVFVGVELEGTTSDASEAGAPVVDRRVITPGYLETMGIPLVDGRELSLDDGPDEPPVAIVNETLARRFWPSGAIGRRVRLQLRSGPGPWLTVVGVVGDVRHHGLDTTPSPELYVPYAQAPVATAVALLRAPSTALALASAARAREEVWALDASLPLDGLGDVASLVDESIAAPRLRMLVLNGFGALALLLAALGVYGVTAYTVARRTREIGLRMALGAEAKNVVALIVGRGMLLALVGVTLGAAAAVLLSRFLEGLLFGVSSTDATTFVLGSLLITLVTAIACYLPARKATRVDPVEALRPE